MGLGNILLVSLFLSVNYSFSNINLFEQNSKINYLKFIQDKNLQEYNEDFVDNLYNFNYFESATTITVLTSGMYGTLDAWFPKYNICIPNYNVDYLNVESLPYKIIQNTNYDLNNIPILSFTPNFTDLQNKDVDIKQLAMIQNGVFDFINIEGKNAEELKELFSKHIVLLYAPSNDILEYESQNATNEELAMIYGRALDSVLAKLSIFYGGKLPKINLIGHSRGGILNLYYASKRPKIVDNFITIGSPLNGSIWANAYNSYTKLYNLFTDNFDHTHPYYIPGNYDGLLEYGNNIYNESMLSSLYYSYKVAIGAEMSPSLFCTELLNCANIIHTSNINEITFGNNNIFDQILAEIIQRILDNNNLSIATITGLCNAIKDICDIALATVNSAQTITNLINILPGVNLNNDYFETLCDLIHEFAVRTKNVCNNITDFDIVDDNYRVKGDFCVDIDSQTGNNFSNSAFNERHTIPFGESGYDTLLDSYLSDPNQEHVVHNYEPLFPPITSLIYTILSNRSSIDSFNIPQNITINPYSVPFYYYDENVDRDYYFLSADYSFFGDEFGFRDYYYYENEIIINEYLMERYIVVNNLRIDTLRMRTGFIQNERIVLSPNRTNAGLAFIEFYFDRTIRGLSFDISLWSSNELIISSNLAFAHTFSENFSHYIRFDENNYFNGYSYQYNSMTERGQAALLNDNGIFSNILEGYDISTLPVLRNHPTTKYIAKEDGFRYIGFYAACNVNSNDRNKGRICLSNFNIFL